MLLLKKYQWVFVAAFFVGVFLTVLQPLVDFDIWFHLKSGEIISKLGLIHYDVFSYTANGQVWFPYEWLFQVIVYHFSQIFGFESLKFLTAGVVTAMVFSLYLILRRIFSLNTFWSFLVCFFFVVSDYEYFTARPQIFAYTFIFLNLFLILLYFIKRKNLLILTIPITLAWANMHGSIFLDPAFFFGYSSVALLNFWIFREKHFLKQFQVLGIWGIITCVLTILPPIGTIQYQLLVLFAKDNGIISRFIDEWTPLSSDPLGFIFYTTTLVLVVLITLWTAFKIKNFRQLLWFLPLTILPFTAYSASRNVVLGYIVYSIMLGWSLSKLEFSKLKIYFKLSLVLLLFAFLAFHVFILQQKKIPNDLYYPVDAVNFIKDYNLTGHMFNEYGYGGYFLYNLYPRQKVFIDGRTDVYLQNGVLQNMLKMAIEKNLSDQAYSRFLYQNFWNKYDISFVVLRTEKNTIERKIGRVLENDPNWSLVEWDDDAQILVRHDGKNDQIIKQFGTQAATPYQENPYLNGKIDQALSEYQRMVSVVDSAHSRNAIGFIYLHQGKFDQAKLEFEKATQLDSNFESPYMNLGEISAKDGDFSQAIKLYQIAKNLAPDRGLIYIRLGQLTLQNGGSIDEARSIWQEGLKNVSDETSKESLQRLISQNAS